MGCTPSIHVSQTGVVYCREQEDSNSRHPSGYNSSSTTTATATTTRHIQQRAHLLKGDSPSVITSTTSSASVGIRAIGDSSVGGGGGGSCGGGSVGGVGVGGGVKASKRRTSGASLEVVGIGVSEELDGNTKYVVIRSSEQADTQTRRNSVKTHDKDCMFGAMRQPHRTMSILLVLDKEDFQSDALWGAAEKLGYRCTIAKTSENALENYLNHRQDVVIIDNRTGTNGFDAECLCRSMKSTKYSEYSVFVAIVDRVPTDEEEPSISSLLKAGFSRIYHDNTSISACVNELQSLEAGEVRACLKLQSCAALLAALDSVSDAVEITSNEHEIQYVNQVYERLCGYNSDEILGKNTTDFLKTRDTMESINRQTKKGKQWEGTYYTRRKSGGSLPFHCKVIPLLLGPGGSVSNYVYVKSQLPDSYNQLANGSMMAFARRRESVVKAHSVTIEAPITKVINIINAAQENSPLTVAQALDKVLEILQTSELYSPFQHQDIPQDDDPIASDLVEGLMTNVKRKLSGHDIHRATHAQSGHSHITTSPAYSLSQIPGNIMNILNQDANWDMDIIELEKLTNKRPLLFLGLKIFTRFEVCDYLNISEACLVNWLQLIESNYHTSNHYHNSTHAADVLQATAYFLEKNRSKEIFTQQDRIASLIAAVVHDVDHPARTNAFLINEKHQLALLYNDQAVLENHHASMCFKLTHKDKGVDIFKNLSIDDYKSMRQSIIDQVLATDMKQHFEHLSKFTTSITKHLQKLEGDNTVDTDCEQDITAIMTDVSSHENRTLIKRMMIKCADISNPLRSIKVCKDWAYRIAEEYCQQTDEEKQRGMPCVMAQFDRKVLNIPKCQLAFINLFISNMFDAWDVFCDIPELMNQLQTNFDYWTSQQELRDKELSHNPEEDQS